MKHVFARDYDGDSSSITISMDSNRQLWLTQAKDKTISPMILVIRRSEVERFFAELDVVISEGTEDAPEELETLRYEVRSHREDHLYAAFEWVDRAGEYQRIHGGYVLDTETGEVRPSINSESF